MKQVYLFSEGNKDMKDILGGKGANLSEMTNMHLPVPNGFIVSTAACKNYYKNNKKISNELENEIFNSLKELERITSKNFGDKNNPLLVSVRSGSPISMPGMMDTILNLGLNDVIAASLSKDENTLRFIYDSYRRLVMMFADVVKGKGKEEFERLIDNVKKQRGVKTDIELSANDIYEIALESKKIYKNIVGEEFPQDPKVQLIEAICAVFDSWNNKRATVYRKINNISDDLGTAVNVQQMVYGNLSEKSLTGVMFSRNPSTGEDALYGEYLEKAQGEDIVSGVRTPKSMDAMKRDFPNIYSELSDISKILEKHYKDMQDMEFTVEEGKLYILQTRNGKRTTRAALKIAIDLVKEKLITKKQALMMIEPDKLDDLLHPIFDEEKLKNEKPITKGLPASPGATYGQIYFTKEDVIKAKKENKQVILVREETSAEDIEGMNISDGIITVKGGMTSHAAVVARSIGKCCISGCDDIKIENNMMSINNTIYKQGDFISLDGTNGYIYKGIIETKDAIVDDYLKEYLSWAKEIKKIGVFANAETEKDVLKAKELGAEGIGLVRSEHMFFEKEKLLAMRKVILEDVGLEKLYEYQKNDFEKILKIMDNKTVTIRYLDPPLHEFLPKTDDDINQLSIELNIAKEQLVEKISSLKEVNPMMGHRGCRLLITYPDIIKMQTKAIVDAIDNLKQQGFNPKVEVMIPLISDVSEFNYLKKQIESISNDIKIGSMIEVPRSVVNIDKLTKVSNFFSFGTNDLTQMTYGFSRDDSTKFINDYYSKGIFKTDPFKTIDKDGVGKLIEVAVKLSRKIKPNISFGICGEHGADKESIEFFNKIGVNYVSCSPYRLPIAILACCQAEIKASGK